MAINKKLIHFGLKTNFEKELDAGNILDTSIVFIKDAKLIWTHGQYYGYDSISGDLKERLDAIDETIEENELITAKALTELDKTKANISDTLEGYGITDAYTKEEIDSKVGSVESWISEVEEVTAAAIVDLNEKIIGFNLITYLELKSLIENSALTPSAYYKITDYVTTTSLENTRSLGKQFDLIVRAVDTNSLSEDAIACLHEGDTYFSDSSIEAWEIKYNVENDTDRFSWADPNGSGVIYYMKDEFSNECPYDFKNIQFHKDSTWLSENSDWKVAVLGAYTGTGLWLHTFTHYNSATGFVDDSLKYYTTTSSSHYAHGNIIKEYYRASDGKLDLNSIVFLTTTTSPYNNVIDFSCHNLIFGDNCNNNTLGTNSNNNIIGNNFQLNKIGSGFNNNKVYNTNKNSKFISNTILNDCSDNIFPRQFISNFCGDNFIGNDFISQTEFSDLGVISNCDFGNNFAYNIGMPYKLSNIEVLDNTLIFGRSSVGNWSELVLNTGKTLNEYITSLESSLGKFRLRIGINEFNQYFAHDVDTDGIYHLGEFSTFDSAMDAAKAPEVAGKVGITRMIFTSGVNSGIIDQCIHGSKTLQSITWNNGFRMRILTFSDTNRTELTATSDWYWSNPTELYYDSSQRKIALTRFDDGCTWGMSGCFGGVELPLATQSKDGLMSGEDKKKIDSLIKTRTYNFLEGWGAGNDWSSSVQHRHWYRLAKIKDKGPSIIRLSSSYSNDIIFTASVGWSNASSANKKGSISVLNCSIDHSIYHAVVEGIRLVEIVGEEGAFIDLYLNPPYANSSNYVDINATIISNYYGSDYNPFVETLAKVTEVNDSDIIQTIYLEDKAMVAKDFISSGINGENPISLSQVAEDLSNHNHDSSKITLSTSYVPAVFPEDTGDGEFTSLTSGETLNSAIKKLDQNIANIVEEILDNEEVMAQALTDLNETKTTLAEVEGWVSGNYKPIQTAVSSPTSSTGNTTSFVDTISQNSDGVISFTKKSVDLSQYLTTDELASVAFSGSYGDLSGVPEALKNPYLLTIQTNGTTLGTYDGSSAETLNITAASLGLSSALKYCGVTTTNLVDDSTVSSIIINGTSHTATAGCVVFYGDKEYVYNGTKWEELGYPTDLSSYATTVWVENNYKAKQEAISCPDADGSAGSFIDTISQDEQGKITATKKNVDLSNYLKKGETTGNDLKLGKSYSLNNCPEEVSVPIELVYSEDTIDNAISILEKNIILLAEDNLKNEVTISAALDEINSEISKINKDKIISDNPQPTGYTLGGNTVYKKLISLDYTSVGEDQEWRIYCSSDTTGVRVLDMSFMLTQRIKDLGDGEISFDYRDSFLTQMNSNQLHYFFDHSNGEVVVKFNSTKETSLLGTITFSTSDVVSGGNSFVITNEDIIDGGDSSNN